MIRIRCHGLEEVENWGAAKYLKVRNSRNWPSVVAWVMRCEDAAAQSVVAATWLTGITTERKTEARTEEVRHNKCSESRATRPGRQQGVEEEV